MLDNAITTRPVVFDATYYGEGGESVNRLTAGLKLIDEYYRERGADVSVSLSVHHDTDGKRPSHDYALWLAEQFKAMHGGDLDDWQRGGHAGVSVRNKEISFTAFYEEVQDGKQG